MPFAATGLPADGAGPPWAAGTAVEVVLVVEGAARGVPGVPGVRVEAASGSGDDLIVELAAAARDRDVVVVTADRALRLRVGEVGAVCVGPRAVRSA